MFIHCKITNYFSNDKTFFKIINRIKKRLVYLQEINILRHEL